MEEMYFDDPCNSTFAFPTESSDAEKDILKEDKHLFLRKNEVIIDDEYIPNLYGKLVYNNDNIPKDKLPRTENSKYIKYRKLFKIVGRISRKLNFSDQGHTNSEILINKLHINKTSNTEIKQIGDILYRKLKKLLL